MNYLFNLEKFVKAEVETINNALEAVAEEGEFISAYHSNPIEGENDEFGVWDACVYLESVNGQTRIVLEGFSQCQGFGYGIKCYFNGRGDNVATVLTERNNKYGKYKKSDLALFRMISLSSLEIYLDGTETENFIEILGDILIKE